MERIRQLFSAFAHNAAADSASPEASSDNRVVVRTSSLWSGGHAEVHHNACAVERPWPHGVVELTLPRLPFLRLQ